MSLKGIRDEDFDNEPDTRLWRLRDLVWAMFTLEDDVKEWQAIQCDRFEVKVEGHIFKITIEEVDHWTGDDGIANCSDILLPPHMKAVSTR
jgi:hypothetical protein